MKNKFSRRNFLTSASALAASAAVTGFVPLYGKTGQKGDENAAAPAAEPARGDLLFNQSSFQALDLSPAQWIWYPAKRILPNSFFHFRKKFDARKPVQSARGWIVGDSRYVLFCNGQRLQFGPAPSDPRFTEADPVELTSVLQQGSNVIGATVLYYGFGDGTWPAGKAGFIFRLDVTYNDGSGDTILSDSSWKVQAARSWEPGMYKRWYLRALQEAFDNRYYPAGWTEANFKEDKTWRSPMITGKEGNKTALATAMSDYLYDSGSPAVSQLRKRGIPLIREEKVPVENLVESHWVRWNLPPEEYFDLVTADAYEAEEGPEVIILGGQQWSGTLGGEDKGLVMTFRLKEQVVGFPYFTIEAPEGTVIELMVQQGHVPYPEGGPALINNNLNSWTRFICKSGRNDFMTFDFESAKWIQLHIRGAEGTITISQPGVLRRVYPFRHQPALSTSDGALQKLFSASFNTIINNSQETIVDCMGRERQQYSGDIGHVVHLLHRAYGEQQLPARFVSTFSQGLTLDGYFMDSWPAYDRLNRLAQRQLGLTPWGPLLDHGVGFTYDCWYHYLYSGRKEDLEEVFPRLTRFYQYLLSLPKVNGLLPVENLGVPTVWMDTDSYQKQRHKQCAFNLYVAGMLKDAFAPLCAAFNRPDLQKGARQLSTQLVSAVRQRYWSQKEGMLIVNLPWLEEEGEQRTCERSISQFILSGFATDVEMKNLLEELVKTPRRLGLCYPPNAPGRYWALAAGGEIQPVLDEFRTKWIHLPAVQQNNTMPETWQQVPDTHAQYSHASLAPIYVAYLCLAGVMYLQPGGKQLRIQPQPGDLEQFSIFDHTPNGPVAITWEGKKGKRSTSISLPPGVAAELCLDPREKVALRLLRHEKGKAVYQLHAGATWSGILQFC